MAYDKAKVEERYWPNIRDAARKTAPTQPKVQNMLGIDITIPEDVTTASKLWRHVRDVLKETDRDIGSLCGICRRCSNCQCKEQTCFGSETNMEYTKTKLSMFVNFTN